MTKVEQQTAVESIRGLEGMAAKFYFEGRKKMFLGNLTFPGRQKHPAPDPINGMLSLGYTLVFNELTSLLDAIGLNPYIGLFHKIYQICQSCRQIIKILGQGQVSLRNCL